MRNRGELLLVSASQYEGFGLTLVEALAAGLLPIVSTIPSFASILGGFRTGYADAIRRRGGAPAERWRTFIAQIEEGI